MVQQMLKLSAPLHVMWSSICVSLGSSFLAHYCTAPFGYLLTISPHVVVAQAGSVCIMMIPYTAGSSSCLLSPIADEDYCYVLMTGLLLGHSRVWC
jgi:hypothetical protein